METISANYEKVFAKAKAGNYKNGNSPIVLNHEVNENTMNEIIDQYPNIKANFKYIVPVASGLNVTNPYAEQNITYPTFAEVTGNSEGAPSGTSNGTTPASGSGVSGSGGSGSDASGTGSSTTSPSGSSNGTSSEKKTGGGNGASTIITSSSLVAAGISLSLLL
jgi:hypothetical protein